MGSASDRTLLFDTGMCKDTRPAKKYACLVDAENAQPSKLSAILDEMDSYGQLVVRKLYGDFSRIELRPWRDVSNKLAFKMHTQFAPISGKGSSDMVMAMDAITILHDDHLVVDGFALVSSDSDFIPLASNLRQAGKVVIGFGRRHTPKPFVEACTKFVYVEDLNNESKNNHTCKSKVKAEATKLSAPVSQINIASAGQVSKQKTEPLAGLVAAVSAALTACRKKTKVSAEALKDGWVS